MHDCFTADWVLRYFFYHVPQFGDPIDTSRYVISVSISTHTLDFVRNVVPIGHGTCITGSSPHIVNIDNLCIPATDLKPFPLHKAHIVAILHSSDNINVNSYSTSNLVLDTELPAMEPALQEYNNVIFGRRFGVLIPNEQTSCARKLSNIELFWC